MKSQIEEILKNRKGDGSMSVTIEMNKGVPIDAVAFAKTILNTRKLLLCVAKEIDAKAAADIDYRLSAVGIVGNRASATLTPHSKKHLRSLENKAKAAAPHPTGEGDSHGG